MCNIETKLIEKSKEAFMLAIELYNKPTLRYRVEGFSLFICNAWELMLKAHMIKTRGESSIYYRDHPERTLSLENCIQKVFTNEKAPLRLNLERIIELRNTSTHFITEEYEVVYIPLFQACVFNYVSKMMEFHGEDVTKDISQSFLTLAVSTSSLSNEELHARYPNEIANRLIAINEELSSEIEAGNSDFAIRVDHRYYLTKNKSEASATVAIDSGAEGKVKIVRDIRNPNDTHKYTCKKCCKEINQRLARDGVVLKFKGEPKKFNDYHFQLFCDYYNIKTNEKYCFVNRIYVNPTYSYSIHVIDLIYEEILKNPEHIIEVLREKLKEEKS